MPSTLVVPEGFSYLAASLVGTTFLLAGQTITVSQHRKASGVEYPQLYAEKAEAAASPSAMKFNCAQRAHQNTLEQMPSVIIGSIATGLKYPKLAAGVVALWVVSRIAYTRGYCSGVPKKASDESILFQPLTSDFDLQRTNFISMFGTLSSLCAHQNTLEQISSVHLGALVTGLKYPKVAAANLVLVQGEYTTREGISLIPKSVSIPLGFSEASLQFSSLDPLPCPPSCSSSKGYDYCRTVFPERELYSTLRLCFPPNTQPGFPSTSKMPKDFSRFPASSADFALPASPFASSSALTLEDTGFMPHRFRRPSVLTPKATYLSESRLNSPLASSFTLIPSPKRKTFSDEECPDDSPTYRDRMTGDSSPSGSSENPTPPLPITENSEEDLSSGKSSRPKSLHTPPRKLSSPHDAPPFPRRRLSFPVKQPRIANLLAESRPIENEVKSEAAFQRLLASGADLPMSPHTARPPSDRGRYPEEAGSDDFQREETPSDDEELDDESSGPSPFPSSVSEPINIARSSATSYTPASSVSGDDLNTMCISESPCTTPMEVDLPFGSPSMSSVSSTPINHWRYTPPPTTSVVRSNKRKLDDRFDPYPNTSKRRAVSPSVSYLRENHPIIGSPVSRSNPRLPIAIPVSVPGSAVNSTTSSPTVGSYSTRPVPMTSSPTMRASMGLASPIFTSSTSCWY
ncbi:hypothetical protein D9758_002316 [Tetrapyrgos nigripes]|uniref:Uncharacterized protein n=1 Tax=Tetrapyrgos nigripes TaxID=182062 RepID=A0A8H5GPA8_9AGAR|nr:hypothetical protein D9758_002316 [Tetrapyrgos nigripes]